MSSPAIGRLLAAMPVYFVALLVGWRLFGLAGDRTYRLVTFGLIIAAAILALPVWGSVAAAIETAFAQVLGASYSEPQKVEATFAGNTPSRGRTRS